MILMVVMINNSTWVGKHLVLLWCIKYGLTIDTVIKNTTAGFGIYKYKGHALLGAYIGHGLV